MIASRHLGQFLYIKQKQAFVIEPIHIKQQAGKDAVFT